MTNRTTQQIAAGAHRDRPGWPEVVVGLIGIAVIGFGLASQFPRLGLDRVSTALLLTGWTGVAGLASFGAAWLVRRRPLSSFGVRGASRRWLLIGAGVGVATFLVRGPMVVAFTAMTGLSDSPQAVFADVAEGGAFAIIAATLLLGVLTPLGEEFLFRGVITSALLRYGAVIGVVLSALLFALAHGVNIVFPVALLHGLVSGELFRRSGSIWPPVIVHIVCNLPAMPIVVLAAS